ncbi:hypothetical protein Leryth_025162 [Lithospermum erythrorhizon]|nr:hypothetical protein Leryth_025162 [Lithospermum erythrorhizon]
MLIGQSLVKTSASAFCSRVVLFINTEETKINLSETVESVPVVDQETDPDNQLASNKNRLVRASLVCFGCATTGLDCSLPLKVIPTQHQEVLPKVSLPDKDKDQTYSLDLVVEENIIKKVTIKSCLRKPKNKKILVSCGSNEEHEVSLEKDNDSGWQTETTQTRKVQWTDTHGGELVEIREFEARKSTCLPMLCLPLSQS